MDDLLFVDWDDTLVHNRRTVQKFKERRLYERILAENGVTISKDISQVVESVTSKFSIMPPSARRTTNTFYQMLLEEIGAENRMDLAKRLEESYCQTYAEITEFMPTAKEFLQIIKERGARTVLVSDGFSNRIGNQLRRFGLEDYFAVSLFSDHNGFKEEGMIFKEARRIYGYQKSPTFIGDNPLTDKLAEKEGFRVILVDNHYSEYTGIERTTLVDTLLDAVRALE